MLPRNPLVSILTITYNSEKFLKETIESVLGQTYQHFEYIIQDGGSTDDTLSIARSFQDSRISIYVEQDSGISDAMNKGIQKVRGSIVGIIHSDDAYFPEAIEKSIHALQTQKKRWSYGKLQYTAIDGTLLYTAGTPYSIDKLKKFMQLNHPTMFCETSMYKEFGLFDVRLRLAMDYDLALRFALQESPAFIDSTIAKMRLGGESSKTFASEFGAAKEGLASKLRVTPEQKISACLYFVWTIVKLSFRKMIGALPFGKLCISKLRRFVNPNFLESN